MKLNRLIGTIEVALTTTPTAIAVPKYCVGATVLILGAQDGSNNPIQWRRQNSATATASKLCPDQDTVLVLNVSEEYPPFYAKTTTGTGILEIEFWK